MSLLDELFPWNKRNKEIQKIKDTLEKTPLKKIRTEHKKHIRIPNTPIPINDHTENLIHKYELVTQNLHRIWKETKDKDITYAILYTKMLKPLNKEITQYNITKNKTPELQEYMIAFQNHLKKLLSTYEELHTQNEDEDEDIEKLYQNMMKTEEEQ